MPTLEFKGKQFIYSHHHSVPFRELRVNDEKSLPADGKKPSLDDNLIIHGDNLHALKALMPHYAGKIKCIYIDPPYNTGNEGWCYNDNVNSPLMKEWISKNANPVDKEDMQRHDKWLCMMYPRLKLLHELLADDGVIFVSIDDNEVHHLRAVMEEIWEDTNFIATITWRRKKESANDNKGFTNKGEYILVFGKSQNSVIKTIQLSEEYLDKSYNEPNSQFSEGKWRPVSLTVSKGLTGGGYEYEVITPNGTSYNRVWSCPKNTFDKLVVDNLVYWGKSNGSLPQRVIYAENSTGIPPSNLWLDIATNKDGKKEILEILEDNIFQTPKPHLLIKEMLKIATDKNSIILDSFAGSGTTAHAVLDLNKEDGGNRKFILVEMEDYADIITAERVRRVIGGVPAAKDGNLRVGLGGSFTFCELGNEISIEKILTGEALPDYGALASYVFYTATGKSLDGEAVEKPDYFVGETDLYEVYLVYKPDIAFLRGNESALDDLKLKAIAARGSKKEKLVFATAKYRGQKELSAQHITFCQLPYAIHKVVGA
jgi:adenine-specific DNA-methyltransferase